MSTPENALPQLDMSTSVPLDQTAPTQNSALPKLDLSTSVPLDQQTSAAPVAPATGALRFVNQIGEGAAEGARDIWGVAKNMIPGGAAETGALKTVWSNLPPVQLTDAIKQVLPVLHVYEQKRASGASISDSIKATDDLAKQHQSNILSLKPAVDAVRENPTRETVRALADASAAALALFGPGAVAGELAPEAAANAAKVAPAAEAEAVGSPNWLARNNPFRQGGPIRQAISPTAAAQPEAQAALRQGATTSAADAGVTTKITPVSGAGIRTLMTQPIAEAAKVEDGLYATVNKAAETDMKSLYDRQEELQDAIDEPTNISQKPALQTELTNIQGQIAKGEANVQGKLGTDASKLISQAKAATQQRYAMETGDAKLFNNESIVKGNVAHGGTETINVDPAIRQAELLDKPSKFAPRGSPTRLQQMFGVDGAKAFKQGLYDAQKAGQTVLNRNKVLGILAGSGVSIAGAIDYFSH